MNDPLRDSIVVTVNLLRAGTEFAPKGEQITANYIDVWASVLGDAGLAPQEVVLAGREYLKTNTVYPAPARLVKIALEMRDHKNQIARAQHYIRGDHKAITVGTVTDEQRREAREKLGITDLDLAKAREAREIQKRGGRRYEGDFKTPEEIGT